MEIVIAGGGFTGLLTAYALSDYVNHITIIERSPPKPNQRFRNGIPQSQHLHVLLKAGQNILFDIMPSIKQQLLDAQCQSIDWAQDTHWQGPYGIYPKYDASLDTLLFSRALLDRCMYQQIQSKQNITLISAKVESLLVKNQHVYGLRYQNADDALLKTITADLVIDTRGRNTKTAVLLSSICNDSIRNLVVNNSVSYNSRIFTHQKDNSSAIKQYYLQAHAIKQPHGVVCSPIESNQIMVTQIGFGESALCRTDDAFEKKLNQIDDDRLHALLQNNEAISSAKTFSNLHNVRVNHKDIKQWPTGLIVIGDALCRVNPIYGQGMTLAAQQVNLLQRHIANKQYMKPRWEHTFQTKIN